MLGKLIKYELLSETKKVCALFIAIITIAVSFFIINTGLSKLSSNGFFDFLSTTLIVVYIILCIFSVAIILILSINRFYSNIFRDEGYLMNTLPVPAWQHIVSKIIANYIWVIADIIVIVLSICIVASDVSWIGKIPEFVNLFMDGMSKEMGSRFVNVYFGFMRIFAVLTPLCFLLYIYFCIAIGNLFNKNKVLMSVVTFVAVSVFCQIVGSIFLAIVGFTNYDTLIAAENYDAIADLMQLCFGYSIIFSVIEYVAMFLVTNFIMKKKLNLE